MFLVMNSSSSSPFISSFYPTWAPPIPGWYDETPKVNGQRDVIVILAFISGASFISLIIILSLFAFCRFVWTLLLNNVHINCLSRWRSFNRDDDTSSSHSIIYNIEQDRVSFNPIMEKQMQVVLSQKLSKLAFDSSISYFWMT